jgi:hypothetical protein
MPLAQHGKERRYNLQEPWTPFSAQFGISNPEHNSHEGKGEMETFCFSDGVMTMEAHRHQKSNQTQWTGQFGVAHELTRRGYLVAFTMGNTPDRDLLCESPKGTHFSVQVKSLSSHFAFLFQESLLSSKQNLYFILTVVPAILPSASNSKPTKPVEYFVLNQKQLRQVVDEQKRVDEAAGIKRGRPLAPFSPGVSYSVLAKRFNFRDAWGNLPA